MAYYALGLSERRNETVTLVRDMQIKSAHRAVAAYLKVVRRRKSSCPEGTRGERAREGDYLPLVWGVLGASPENFLNCERFYERF